MTNTPVPVKYTWWQKYGQTITSAAYAVSTVVIPLWSGDKRIDTNEWIIIVAAVAGAMLTYIVPLVPNMKWLKTGATAVLAAMAVVQNAIASHGHLASDDWLLVAAAILGTLGVSLVPATSKFKTIDGEIVTVSRAKP